MIARTRLLTLATVLVMGLVAVPPATAVGTPRYVEGADEAALFFDPQQVVDIKMTMPQSSIDALWADPKGEYMPGTIVVKTKPQTVGPLTVGIRLKVVKLNSRSTRAVLKTAPTSVRLSPRTHSRATPGSMKSLRLPTWPR